MSEGAIHGLTTAFSHGRAFTETLYPVSPAAGSGYSLTVDGGYYDRIVACTFTLTTSSHVSSRGVTVDYVNPGSGRFYSAGPTVLQTASGTGVYNASIGFGASDWNTGTAAFFSLPDLILPVGFQVQINVSAIDTADTLTGIALIRERFQTGYEGFPTGFLSEDEYAERYETIGR